MTMIYPYIVYIYSKYINNNTYSIIHVYAFISSSNVEVEKCITKVKLTSSASLTLRICSRRSCRSLKVD